MLTHMFASPQHSQCRTAHIYLRFFNSMSTIFIVVLQQFNNILHAFVTLFSIMLGGTDLDLFYNSHNPIIGIILLLLFVFTMSMVLLNCLIAIMSDACSRASLLLLDIVPLHWQCGAYHASSASTTSA